MKSKILFRKYYQVAYCVLKMSQWNCVYSTNIEHTLSEWVSSNPTQFYHTELIIRTIMLSADFKIKFSCSPEASFSYNLWDSETEKQFKQRFFISLCSSHLICGRGIQLCTSPLSYIFYYSRVSPKIAIINLQYSNLLCNLRKLR